MSQAAAAPGLSSLLSDERLTRRAVGGDDRAFAAIFRRYHQPLYRFCLAIVGNPEDAQDALQNAMVKVLRALPGEERKIDLKPWLYRIAHNESIDLLRRRRETSQLDVEQVAPGYGLAEDAATRERLRRLVADLLELPERQRKVLVMREMSGLDFVEIAAALDTSGAVARQTLYEARQSLRQMEEGREMSCETVGRALSYGDGRVTRRRDVRAHLRSCVHCRDFRDEIKRRERDFAALAPLPAVAAAGMLQGLLGGGSQAATGGAGGGLAATLGGGAAKTIATSAAVKGVATVAVVAAVGVSAADRSGVIHLGLPGEESSKAAPATPSAGGSPGSGAAKDGAGGESDGVHAAAGRGTGAVDGKGLGAASGPQSSAAPAGENEHGQAHHEASSDASSNAQGRPAEVETGAEEHEKPHPEAAGGGQETAAEHKLEEDQSVSSDDQGEEQDGDEEGEGSGAPVTEKPTVPGPPAAKPPPANGGSANPPKGAAPEAPPPANPPKPATKTDDPPPPAPANTGKGSENKP
jgi:RNA polymerase sigma factor (sigma-70 family)